MTLRGYLILGAIILTLVAAIAGLATLLSPTPIAPETSTEVFGTGDGRVTVLPSTPEGAPENTSASLPTASQPIFQVAAGPIVSATIIQTLRPTTTVARYVQQNNGHIFDVVLDTSGAVPKSVSNTTIPGIARALWAKKGSAVILQYLDNSLVKTVSLSFPQAATATGTAPVVVRFFPDGILDIAASPDGERAAYLLKTAAGIAGYTAAADGTGSKELFTFHLSEMLMSWPATNTLLLHTKSAGGVPGIAFSVSVTSGAITSLLYAPGLTLTADPTFSYLVYRSSGGETRVRKLSDGLSTTLSYDPYPEKCVWGSATTTLFCAVPTEYTAPGYLDLWHTGSVAAADALVRYNLTSGSGSTIATPGTEGGRAAAIDSLSVSTDSTYLLFVARGDRSLWGVRP